MDSAIFPYQSQLKNISKNIFDSFKRLSLDEEIPVFSYVLTYLLYIEYISNKIRF